MKLQRRAFLKLAGATAAAAGASAAGLYRPAYAFTFRPQATTIKIVSSLPLTGSSYGQTITIVNSINMAIDEIGGKAGQWDIVYESMDDATPAAGKWDALKEAENANKAIQDPDVMVYIGTFNSGAAKVSIPILNKENLVMISPANTYPGLTKPGQGEPNEPAVYYPSGKRNYTRTCPADDIQGSVAAAWAQQLGAKSIYVLDDTELYGNGIAKVFVAEAKKRGLTIANGDTEGIDGKASNYTSLANKIAAAKPDMIYFGGITQNNAGQLVKDIRDAGITAQFMGPDGIFESAFIKAAAEAAEGVYVTFGGVPPDKLTGAGAEWYSAYKRKFNGEPEAYAAYGYEAARVALNAIQRAGAKDREAVRAAVFSTANYAGVLGTWSFDVNGDTSLTTMSGNVIKNGKFEFVGTLTA